MATLKAIRLAIQATLEANIATIKCYNDVPQNPAVLPCVVVRPNTIEMLAMGRGSAVKAFILTILVSAGDTDVGQDTLDDLWDTAGTNSIWQVVFQNRTLGLGGGIDAVITHGDGYGLAFEAIGIPHLGANLYLSVTGPGTS